MKPKIIILALCLLAGCSPTPKTDFGKIQQQQIDLAANAFALGCVTAIHVANEDHTGIHGDALVAACANFHLTNQYPMAKMESDIYRRVIFAHSK